MKSFFYPPTPISVSVPPIEFVRDGINTQVAKDTVTSANTRGLPVEIVAANGTAINITAGDINVQTSHTGANPDSMRIGDGAEELQISAAGEAMVQDSEARASLNSIDTKTPALVSGRVPVDTGLTPGLTDTELRATPVPVSGSVTTGGLTDAELRATPVAVSGSVTTGGLTDAELRAAPVPVSGSVSTGGLTDTELRATPVPVSGSVTTGGLTNTELRATPIAISGALTDAELRASALSVSSTETPMTPSYQQVDTIAGTAQTITAPASAKWCKVMNLGTENLRIRMDGVAATVASGLRLEAGRSEDFRAVGNISVIAESGTGQSIGVQFGV